MPVSQGLTPPGKCRASGSRHIRCQWAHLDGIQLPPSSFALFSASPRLCGLVTALLSFSVVVVSRAVLSGAHLRSVFLWSTVPCSRAIILSVPDLLPPRSTWAAYSHSLFHTLTNVFRSSLMFGLSLLPSFCCYQLDGSLPRDLADTLPASSGPCRLLSFLVLFMFVPHGVSC